MPQLIIYGNELTRINPSNNASNIPRKEEFRG